MATCKRTLFLASEAPSGEYPVLRLSIFCQEPPSQSHIARGPYHELLLLPVSESIVSIEEATPATRKDIETWVWASRPSHWWLDRKTLLLSSTPHADSSQLPSTESLLDT